MDINRVIAARAKIFGVIFTLLFFLLISKAFYIQAVEAPVLKEKAINIWNSSEIISPKRGVLFDRNGERLAYNVPAYTVVAILSKDYPNHVNDPRTTANKLATILKMAESSLYNLLTKDIYQVELRPGGWKIDSTVANQIKELSLPGIILKEEEKRYYPNNAFASYILGFMNYENESIMGLEKYYDEILRGEPGQLNVLRDLKGYELPDSEELFEPAKNGADLVLTIDKTIQQYVESALAKAKAKYNPKKLVAIVVDPKTGEILAMANQPSYNPNEYWNITEYLNYATQAQFEPGSTFKIITLAAAIEEGVFDEEATYQSGIIQVPGGTIKDHNNGLGWGNITYLNGVQRSSNVAFVKLGYELLGKERLLSYINAFGFGKKTGIDINGEVKGIINTANNLYPLDIAAISIGQGIAVTPIQQVMAVSAVANGGNLMQPYLVKEIRNSSTGEVIVLNNPVIKQRVVSEETSKITNEVLEKVVAYGMERAGYIEGYQIAGKTGTAQKVGNDGKYLEDKYVVSYIGYSVSQELLVYVVVDEPDLNIPYYGSTVAVPIFTEIMQNSLRYLKVPISANAQSSETAEKNIIAENYLNQSINSTIESLNNSGIVPIVIGKGKTVLGQYPEKGTELVKGAHLYLITEPKESWQVPNFIGKSFREVLELAYVLNMEIKTVGNGIVVKQSVSPNTFYQGQTVEVTLVEPREAFGTD